MFVSVLNGYICLNITQGMKNKLSFLILLTIVVFASGCKKWPWQDCYKGEGDVFEDSRSFGAIKSFAIDIPSEVFLHPDTTRSRTEIVIVAQENVADEIVLTNSNGHITSGFDGCFREHKEIQFHLYFNTLDELIVNVPSRINTEKAIIGEDFKLTINESANVDVFAYTDELSVSISGAANVRSRGYSKIHRVDINTASGYDAEFLITDTTYVNLQAEATFKSYVTGLLDINMSNGTIEYKGEDTLNITDRKTGGLLIDLRDSL